MNGDTLDPLHLPLTQMPTTIAAADQTAIRAEAETLIRDTVAPAYDRLLTHMRTAYLPRARTTLAATAMPGGEPYYQAMIETFTTAADTRGHEAEPGKDRVPHCDEHSLCIQPCSKARLTAWGAHWGRRAPGVFPRG